MRVLNSFIFMVSLILFNDLLAFEYKLYTSLNELNSSSSKIFLFEDDKISSSEHMLGEPLQVSHHFSIENRKLRYQGKGIVDAYQILFQGQSEKIKVAIIRDERNSYSSLKKIGAALAGHPVQKSEIVLILIENDKVILNEKLISKDSSYDWNASVNLVKVMK